MDLQHFFPYRLAVLADAVSRAVAAVYDRRFGLGREEWRVIAALAEGPMRTGDVIVHTTLDKMQVSRAVARLEAAALVEREPDDDRRARVLRLTASGRALYRRIAPLALAREAFLLDALDADERRALDRTIDKLLQRAQLMPAAPPPAGRAGGAGRIAARRPATAVRAAGMPKRR